MAGRASSVVGWVSLLAYVGGLLMVILGLGLASQGIGATGLAAIALVVGVLLAVAGGLVFAVGALLGRASKRLAAVPPDVPEASTTSRRVSTVLVLLIATAWLGAATLTTIASGLNLAVIAVYAAILVVASTAAYAARYFPGQGLGAGLSLVALLGLGAGGWWLSTLVGDAVRRVELTESIQRSEERYEPFRHGPQARDVARVVGTIGSWSPLSGGDLPDWMSSDSLWSENRRLAELRGDRVTLALTAQCWVDGGGELLVYAWLPVSRSATKDVQKRRVDMPPIPCDGEVHLTTSGPHAIPDWLDPDASLAEREEWLFTGAAFATRHQGPDGTGVDSAGRWLIYVSAEHATPAEHLREAVSAQLKPLVLK